MLLVDSPAFVPGKNRAPIDAYSDSADEVRTCGENVCSDAGV